MKPSMILIDDIGHQPDAHYYQDDDYNERERVHDHAVSVVVLSTVAFEFSDAQQKARILVIGRLAPDGSLPRFGTWKAHYAMIVVT
jgi:hypothetical protein